MISFNAIKNKINLVSDWLTQHSPDPRNFTLSQVATGTLATLGITATTNYFLSSNRGALESQPIANASTDAICTLDEKANQNISFTSIKQLVCPIIPTAESISEPIHSLVQKLYNNITCSPIVETVQPAEISNTTDSIFNLFPWLSPATKIVAIAGAALTAYYLFSSKNRIDLRTNQVGDDLRGRQTEDGEAETASRTRSCEPTTRIFDHEENKTESKTSGSDFINKPNNPVVTRFSIPRNPPTPVSKIPTFRTPNGYDYSRFAEQLNVLSNPEFAPRVMGIVLAQKIDGGVEPLLIRSNLIRETGSEYSALLCKRAGITLEGAVTDHQIHTFFQKRRDFDLNANPTGTKFSAFELSTFDLKTVNTLEKNKMIAAADVRTFTSQNEYLKDFWSAGRPDEYIGYGPVQRDAEISKAFFETVDLTPEARAKYADLPAIMVKAGLQFFRAQCETRAIALKKANLFCSIKDLGFSPYSSEGSFSVWHLHDDAQALWKREIEQNPIDFPK